MKPDAFQKYMLKKSIGKKQEVQLQLSDSSNDNKQKNDQPRLKQLKISEMFSNRLKNKPQEPKSESSNKQIQSRLKNNESRFKSSTAPKNQQINNFPEAKKQIWESIMKDQQKLRADLKAQRQVSVPIYLRKQRIKSQQEKEQQIARNKQIEEQKRLKKQKRKQEQKKKQEEFVKKKNLKFKNFLSNITQKSQKNHQNLKHGKNQGQLQNIALFNKMQEQNLQKIMEGQNKKTSGPSKANVGLTYKKITAQRQKIPISFLKLLFSYKFSTNFPNQQSKKVPNSFQDQMMYKKIFHYLVVNQCISYIHLKLQKIQESSVPSIPITIFNFKTNSEGFIQFTMSQVIKEPRDRNSQNEKFIVKNHSLSRNRLGLITNSKHFKLEHYGIPCPKNERIFGFLCLLVTPQSKQEVLNPQVKGLTSIQVNSLDIILKLNKTNKCFFIDLEKISTHIRQYLAISYLYDTEVAPFIYNPQLIEKHHLQLINEEDRELLQPILQKLKTEYNNTQYQSIRQMALRASGFVLLQGPPGTGKTTTLMGLLAAQYQYQKNICSTDERRKIMICAPSNAAIDHITKRLVCQGLITANSQNSINFSFDGSNCQKHFSYGSQRVFPKILRVGIVESNDKIIQSVSLDHICDLQMIKAKKSNIKRNNMTTVQIKQKMFKISKEINKLRGRKDIQEWQKQDKTMALKYQIQKYQSLLFNFRKQKIELKQTYNQIQKKLLDEAQIILSTLSSSGSDKLEQLRGFIGCLIIDEAAQATQPNILIPLQTGVRKVLLIGDPCQLPSTTISQDSSITLFNRSLFERFLDNGIKPYFLNIQYRMAPLIRQFPSSTFYNNRLIDAESVITRYNQQKNGQANQNPIKLISHFFNRNSIFIDVKFGQEQFHGNSYKNVGECLVLKNFILNFIKKTNLSIGVITPYQSQKKYLIKQLKRQISQTQSLASELQKYSEAHKSKQQNQQIGKLSYDDDDVVEEGQIQKNQNQMKDENDQHKQSQKKQKYQEKVVSIKQPDIVKTLQQLIQERVMINTVDSFQGQQKDIIIVSTVRSNQRKDIGFMKDERRINVALTRSKHLLIVIGNADTVGSNEIWNKYLEWSEKNKCLYQIKQRQSVASAMQKISKGFNHDRIDRIRHKRLSKDVRKIERSEIKREDFGLSNSSKKVKRQKTYNPQHLTEIKQQSNIKTNQNQLTSLKAMDQNIDEKRNEELLQQKRAKEQEAYTLQQVNRRIRQLQEKMKTDSNYAKLFQ